MRLQFYTLGIAAWLIFTQQVFAADPAKAEVETRTATPLGITALSANGRIQPHGLPTRYWFEYGPTTGYGQQTPVQALPPKLAAFYHESWESGPAGWQGGMSGKDLVHQTAGGTSGAYMRFNEPSGDDPNHVDGIGTLHLTSYFYPSTHPSASPDGQGWLGGGRCDFRDAKVTLSVRGNQFVPHGSELVWWTQSDNDLAAQLTANWRRANWAYTGYSLTDALLSGQWKTISYRLTNDTHAWTYGGNNLAQKRPNYAYDSINNSLGNVSCDFFHLLVFVNPQQRPAGSIDIDEFTLAYRNYSLVHPANGAKLVSVPPDGADDAARLTDGWRNGPEKTWRSVKHPKAPQEIVYQFVQPVTIRTIQLHQHPEWPSQNVEVMTSEDGTTFTPLVAKALSESSPLGPNFAFLLERNLDRQATAVKVRILSGYKAEHWGLGEIELFGEGATHTTDDDWYHVNLDLTNLKPGETYHYRLVAENSQGLVAGPDIAYVVPADGKPLASTGEARRLTETTATLSGRLTPMGQPTKFYFEYGPDTNYGSKTPESYGGLQITPRTATAEIADLKPATTYHFRLVGVNDLGMTHGADATFQTK